MPNDIAAIEDLEGVLLSENGNRKITGQHGDIPFIFNQSGDDNIKIGKQITVTQINNFFLFLIIILQNLHPIYCLW